MDEVNSRPLFSLLEKLLPLLEQFLHVLLEEKEALGSLDAKRLMQITEEKNNLLDQIFPLTQQLSKLVPSSHSLKSYLAEVEHSEAHRTLLENFIRTSEAAEKQHLENGMVLVRAAQINEGILRILLGSDESPTYQEKITGRSTKGTGKSLGKA